MIARGRQLRCLWVYAPEVEACSALHGIMWELQRKVREFHQSAETFWLHNGSIVNRNLVEFSNWKPPMLLPWSWLKMIPLLASIISFQRAVPHILFVVVVSFMSFSKCPWFSQVRATPPNQFPLSMISAVAHVQFFDVSLRVSFTVPLLCSTACHTRGYA